MKKSLTTFLSFLLLPFSFNAFAQETKVTNTETIVFMRHAEKPPVEIGQINCQGLNRALKLPKVLLSKFGKPDFIFAPSPSKDIERFGKNHSYIRPLVTIEPTAIQLGIPVNAQFSYKDVAGFSTELLDKKYQNNLIFVAWEHNQLVNIVRFIYSKFDQSEKGIPDWDGKNFDSFYILKIVTDANDKKTVSFSQDQENLNKQSEICPD